MTLRQITLCCALVLVKLCNARLELRTSLLPGKSMISIIPELFGYTGSAPTNSSLKTNIELDKSENTSSTASEATSMEPITTPKDPDPDPPDPRYPVQHAGVPRALAVYPLPLKGSYHELKFNVSWQHSIGPPARDYSLEIRSVTETTDCQSLMCYEYNIPGDASWWLVPAYPNSVAQSCSVRPGCAYHVRLLAHPWDGHTSANLHVALDECVAGVCSCAHSPRLPEPQVKAVTVFIQEELFVNVTWTTPKPKYPQRLPARLKRQRYVVSIAKQMVSDAHPTPWFANMVTRYVDAAGLVHESDTLHWLLVSVTERIDNQGNKRREQRTENPRGLVLDVRLIARVNLIDDRGCLGPEGNATAYDPVKATKRSFGTIILWAAFGGACVLAMGALVAAGSRVVKRILNAFRPAPVSAPIEPLRRRPAWFPLQLRTSFQQAC